MAKRERTKRAAARAKKSAADEPVVVFTGDAARVGAPDAGFVRDASAATPDTPSPGASPASDEHVGLDESVAAVTAGDVVVPDEPVALADVPGLAIQLADEPSAETDEPQASPELKAIVESLIFASPEPLTAKALFKVLDSEPREDVQLALDALRRDYAQPRGLQLVEVAGGFQIVTRTDLHEWVRRLFHERKSTKLSVQALETLAVIAYRQPVTSAEIAEIRAVNTSGVLATLIERKLVKIAGRKSVVGRPFLYATTREFLMRFGLNDLSDLPKVEDMAEVLGFDLQGMLGEPVPSDQLLPLEPPSDAVPDGPAAEAAAEDAAAEAAAEAVARDDREEPAVVASDDPAPLSPEPDALPFGQAGADDLPADDVSVRDEEPPTGGETVN